MRRTLHSNEPGEQLSVSVSVKHPELGSFFAATLNMRRSAMPQLANESAGLRVLWRCAVAHRISHWPTLPLFMALH